MILPRKEARVVKALTKKCFVFPVDYWESRANHDCKDAISDFVGEAVVAYESCCNSTETYIQISTLCAIDREARKLANASKGIAKGFKLKKSWWRVLLVQLVVDGAGENKEWLRDITFELRKLWSLLNWDFEESIRPKYSELNSLLPIPYFAGYGENGELLTNHANVIIEPFSKYPIGGRYKTNGNVWTILEEYEDACLCEPDVETRSGFTPKNYSKIQLKDFERIN